MNGVRFLLDTNFVLGMLKASPAVMGVLGANPPLASKCGYSARSSFQMPLSPPLHGYISSTC